MNEFIHTFSVITHLYLKEKDLLQQAFREDYFYNSAEKMFVLSKYAPRGVRIQMKFTPQKEKKYDKKHRDCKVELIITPAKLLYSNEPMKKLHTKQEYCRALAVLEEILGEIELISGVRVWHEAKIHRLDVAKDIQTPSNAYSQEVIRLAKKALRKTGYHLWTPTEQDVEKTGWAEEDSILFRNHNKGVNSKIYNKLTDMQNNNYEAANVSGLLRFELSLKRKYLKEQGMLDEKALDMTILASVLYGVLDRAEDLLQTHISGPLWSGAMLTKRLQKTYIKIHCRTHPKKLEKMLKYRKLCNAGIGERNAKVEEYYAEIGLSSIYTSDEFKYIPSFADLLAQTEDERILRFVKFH